MKKKQKGFGFVAIIAIMAILTLALVGGGFYLSVEQKEKINLAPETNIPLEQTDNQVNTSTSFPLTTQVTLDADVEKVKTIMKEMRDGYLALDAEKFKKHVSVETQKAFSGGWKIIPATSFVVEKVFKSGAFVVAELTITFENGAPNKFSYTFIRENGEWKFDAAATFLYEKNKNIVVDTSNDANGFVDFVVTGIKVYPEHPIVNDPNVEIVVSIKNIGTKTSQQGALIIGELVEFIGSVPITGGGETAIANPGNSYTWSFKPYKNNAFFNDSDVAGKKTVKITLNKYQDIIESNYTNNTFTQVVEMYSN